MREGIEVRIVDGGGGGESGGGCGGGGKGSGGEMWGGGGGGENRRWVWVEVRGRQNQELCLIYYKEHSVSFLPVSDQLS